MLSKAQITESLGSLEKKYNGSTGGKDPLFFSKLALLEVCGWIEEAMDEMVRRRARNCLKLPDSLSYVENDVIKKTFAFDYLRFRFMLVRVIGLVNVERIEARVDPAVFAKLKAALGALKKVRDSEAHTHIKGMTQQIDAPSLTRSRFQDVYSGLREINRVLGKARI